MQTSNICHGQHQNPEFAPWAFHHFPGDLKPLIKMRRLFSCKSLHWSYSPHYCRGTPAIDNPFCFFVCFVCFLFFCFFLSFIFLGTHSRHMEVPRLGVQSELLPLAYARATANARYELRLQPTPQLKATLDP